MNKGKEAVSKSKSIGSDENFQKQLELYDFDTGLSPYKPVLDNATFEDEDHLIDDGQQQSSNDSTYYDSDDDMDSDEGDNNTHPNPYTVSPGGTMWFTPQVDQSLKPSLGDVVPDLDVAESIYQKYAEAAGFEVRRATEKINPKGLIGNKYFVCSRFGFPTKKSFDSMNKRKHQREQRNSNIKRIGCTAGVKFRLVRGTTTYECYGFDEDHNHMLLRKHDIDFTRRNRQMRYSHQRFVHDAGISNMGASRAHKLHTSLRGGYEYGGPSVVDYQNYKRDCDNFVGRVDAKVLVDLMTKKKELDPNFFFEYNCIGSELHTIFWADEVARFNYSEFGDVISFDATFRTNRHSMVFVPFTAVDNHNCNVIVGSALVGHEVVPNYDWLLQAFRKAHTKPPMMVLTDQCPSMKQAVASVFPDARHRLCMWHIMNKLHNKFSNEFLVNTTFKKQFSKLVWNVHISLDEFETRWGLIIEEFSLQRNKWLKKMYAIRSQWIPAYFKELPLCCLMKTTSRSESANSFFNSFSKKGNNLFQFMLGFEFALDKQRKEQRRLDFHTRNTLPKWLTPSKLERHACKVYTRSVFFEVQTELDRAVWSCSIKSVNTEDEVDTYVIEHLDKKEEKIAEYKVVRDLKEETTVCSCDHIGRHGYLCRHVFKVMLNVGVDAIPEKYILRRWRRDLIPIELQNSRQRICDVDDERRRILNDTYDVVDDVLDILRDDPEKLTSFLSTIKEMRDEFEKDRPYEPRMKRKERGLEQMLGFSRPDNVDIHPPTGIRNKGCGSTKRMVGAAEKAAKKSSKPKRMCSGCKKLSNHDVRNCPAKKK